MTCLMNSRNEVASEVLTRWDPFCSWVATFLWWVHHHRVCEVGKSLSTSVQ